MKRYGALEAGGTKMVCAIGDENGKILERVSIPTRAPGETMGPMALVGSAIVITGVVGYNVLEAKNK